LALGTTTMIVVLAVMNGFQSGPINSILEINSGHVWITDSALSTGPAIRSIPGVRSVLEILETEAIATFGDHEQYVRIRAIPTDSIEKDPGLFEEIVGLEVEKIQAQKGSIAIGERLAQSLGAMKGSSITLLAIGASDEVGLEPKVITLRVTDTFRTGYAEFDNMLGFVSFETAQEYLTFTEKLPLQLIVKLEDPYFSLGFAEKIVKDGLVKEGRVLAWQDANRSFFGALQLEKNVLMMIIAVIFLVVGINIFHSMRRTVYERAEDIAIFKTMGANASDIRTIFLFDGVAIGGIGSLVGAVLGVLIAVNINETFELIEWFVNTFNALVAILSDRVARESFAIFSPSAFPISQVPTSIKAGELCFIVATALLSSIGAAAAASRRLEKFMPAEILHDE
jgi:lipoprotein-releasing system permease protein